LGSTRIVSPALTLLGKAIPGALDRQSRVPGFCQARLSASRIVCVGAGGLISHVAPTLVRKGVGALVILDDDEVDVTNLNRQRFYAEDIGKNKAVALAANLQRECTFGTRIEAFPIRLEEAIGGRVDLECDVAVVGVDNSPARVLASRHFRNLRVPVIFCAVSAEADHGYVFVQDVEGPCFGCLFPDASGDEHFPCPATPAVADVLQAVGALAGFAIDSCVMDRSCGWSYRRLNLADGEWDCSRHVGSRSDCAICAEH
jgi:molybdopterin/thiamine biosynthesis adenylyltransferase